MVKGKRGQCSGCAMALHKGAQIHVRQNIAVQNEERFLLEKPLQRFDRAGRPKQLLLGRIGDADTKVPSVTKILAYHIRFVVQVDGNVRDAVAPQIRNEMLQNRSEQHTSELQSRFDLVCRLLL